MYCGIIIIGESGMVEIIHMSEICHQNGLGLGHCDGGGWDTTTTGADQ